MENIIENGSVDSLMKKFSEYFDNGYMTPYGHCFDIGRTTIEAIGAFTRGTPSSQCGQTGEHDNGNGALMRIAPLVFLNIKDESLLSRVGKIERYAGLTHAHPRSMFGCILYVEFLRQLYLGKEKREALNNSVSISIGLKEYENQFSHYNRIMSGEVAHLEKESIKSGGYVVDTLEAAIWCFFKHNNFKDTVLEAVNLGSDTDTTGIVAGSLAGMYYGLDSGTDEWVNSLAKIDDIKELCFKFSNKLNA
jgi:ADP-ribosylglycohydrolase